MRPLVACFVGIVVASFHSLSAADDPCPAGMKLVDGEYCRVVEATCISWLDKEDASARRCQEYAQPHCAVKTEHRAFCMDATEYTEQHFVALRSVHPDVARGVNLPADPQSRYPMTGADFWQVKEICAAEGNRACKESEFSQACSGKDLTAYPTGNVRRCDLCRCDVRENIGLPDHRVDHRATVEEVAACVSSYGISGLTGNVDEQYLRDESAGAYSVVEKGGHFLPVRNRCINAATTAHSEIYSSFPTLGFRCCSDVRKTQ